MNNNKDRNDSRPNININIHIHVQIAIAFTLLGFGGLFALDHFVDSISIWDRGETFVEQLKDQLQNSDEPKANAQEPSPAAIAVPPATSQPTEYYICPSREQLRDIIDASDTVSIEQIGLSQDDPCAILVIPVEPNDAIKVATGLSAVIDIGDGQQIAMRGDDSSWVVESAVFRPDGYYSAHSGGKWLKNDVDFLARAAYSGIYQAGFRRTQPLKTYNGNLTVYIPCPHSPETAARAFGGDPSEWRQPQDKWSPWTFQSNTETVLFAPEGMPGWLQYFSDEIEIQFFGPIKAYVAEYHCYNNAFFAAAG